MGVIICLLALLTPASFTDNIIRAEQELHHTLFELYNPNVIPITDKSGTINVSMALFIMSVNSIDKKSQTFTLRSFLDVKWTDQFLTWESEDFGGVKKINVKNENIWLPDLALMNVYDSPTKMGQKDLRTTVNNDGNRKAMNRNWSNQKANPALKTKAGNK